MISKSIFKKAIFLILFLYTLSFNLYGQTTFQSILGLNNTDEAESVIQKTDSNFIISGYSSANTGIPNMAKATIKKNGTFLNSAIFLTNYPNNVFIAKKTVKTLDNNYIVLGGIESSLTTGHDIVLLKIDSLNSLIWLKKLIGPNEEYGLDIAVDRTDGGFVIVGTDSVALTAKKEAIVIKTDKNGVFKWGYKLPFSENAAVTSIVQIMSSDDFIVTGIFERKLVPAGIAPTIFIAKIGNIFGSLKSLNYYSRGNIPTIDISAKILFTPNASDNGYLIVGTQAKLPAYNQDILLLKISNDASISWANSYGSVALKDEMASSAVSINDDNNFVVSGYSADTIGNGGKDGFLMKINTAGSAINWQYLYGGANDEQFNNLIQTYDNGFIAVGKSNSAAFGTLSTDFYIVKTDLLGTTECSSKPANFAFTNEKAYFTFATHGGNNAAYLLATNIIAFAPQNLALTNRIICSPLIADAGLDEKVCLSSTLNITGDSASGGKKPYTYKWTNTDGLMPAAESSKQFPTTNLINIDTTSFILEVTDANLSISIDTMKVTALPLSAFKGLPDSTCSSTPFSILTNMAGVPLTNKVKVVGPGIYYNGTSWYFNPRDASPGTHIIQSFGCDTTTKITKVLPAPCVSEIIKDTTTGSVIQPQGIYTDCDGTIYLTNKYDIVSIDTFGVVRNIAGNKLTGGYVDGVKNIARLTFPIGIVKLPNGDIYFADNNNFSIRVIKADSSIHTVAGSPPPGLPVSDHVDGIGTAARFTSPFGMAYDYTHNCLYVTSDDPSNAGNGRIRRIDLSNYNVTTLAGKGSSGATITTTPIKGMSARLNRPKHLTTDGTYIYLTDEAPIVAKNIVRYTIADSTIVRYAGLIGGGMDAPGAGIPRLNGHFGQPIGICNTCSGDLFITDEGQDVLRVIHNDSITYFPDNTKFSKPQGLSLFIKGFIDIANSGDNNVLRLTIKDWVLGPWIGLDTADYTYCQGEPSDTLNPTYKCGTYAGPGISLSAGKYIFTPPTTAGFYDITYSYMIGYCMKTVGKRIRVVANPIHTLPDSAAICSGDSAVLDAGENYINYKWNTSETTQKITVASNGNYIVAITDSIGCLGRDTTVITSRLKPIVEAGTDKAICYGSSLNIGGTPTATGAVPLKYIWTPNKTMDDSTITNPTVTPISTQKYFVTVVDRFFCKASDSINVEVNPLPVADVGAPTFSTCVNIPVKIGAPAIVGFTYSWLPSALLDNANSANPAAIVSSTVSTSFVLTIRNSSTGCTNKDSTLVFVYPNPVLEAGMNDTICVGDSKNLNGIVLSPGIISTKWTPNINLSNDSILNPSISPTALQLYKLTIINVNGCSAMDSVLILVSDVTANAGNDNFVCVGSNSIIGGTPSAIGGFAPISYSWLPNATLNNPSVANPLASPMVSTNYILTVTDKKLCKSTDSVFVNVSKLTINAGTSDTICKGSTTILGGSPTASGGHMPYQYSWLPNININDPTVANPNVRVTTFTRYFVTVTDSTTCSDTASVNIDIYSLPIVDAGFNDSICAGLSTILNGVVSSPGIISTIWTPKTNLTNDSILNPLASPIATQLYKLSITDNNGCTSMDSVLISISDITAEAGNDNFVCIGSNIIIGGTPSAIGGFGTISYFWLPDSTLNNSSIANPLASPIVPTKYRLTATDKKLCKSIDSITIGIFNKPIVNAGTFKTICKESTTTIGGSPTASGGHKPYQYSWLPNIDMNDPTIANPKVKVTMYTKYLVTVTDSAACSDTASVNIDVYPLPITDAGPNDTICFGYNKAIGGSPTGTGTIGPYTYQWSDSALLSNNKIANPIASPLINTIFNVTVTDSRSCQFSDSMIFTVLNKAKINTNDTIICIGESVQVTVNGGSSYLWSPIIWLNNSIISNPIAKPDSNITYQVIIGNKFCSSDTAKVKITVMPVPIITAWPDTIIFRGDEIKLFAIGGVKYLWSPSEYLVDPDSSQNPIVKPLEKTTFIVAGRNIYGCQGYDSVIIRINPLNNVFVPSAFTPNVEGKNRILKVETVGIDKIHFWIYNRWDQLVFETTDKDNGWDGMFNGQLQHSQTFGYVLETEDFEGNKKTYSGTITIIQ